MGYVYIRMIGFSPLPRPSWDVQDEACHHGPHSSGVPGPWLLLCWRSCWVIIVRSRLEKLSKNKCVFLSWYVQDNKLICMYQAILQNKFLLSWLLEPKKRGQREVLQSSHKQEREHEIGFGRACIYSVFAFCNTSNQGAHKQEYSKKCEYWWISTKGDKHLSWFQLG